MPELSEFKELRHSAFLGNLKVSGDSTLWFEALWGIDFNGLPKIG
jgi:hypothetical protein